MKKLMNKMPLNKIALASQRGQGMSEYIIIVALIAVTGIGVFSAFGTVIRNQVATMATELSGQKATTSVERATAAGKDANTKTTNARTMQNFNADAGSTAAP